MTTPVRQATSPVARLAAKPAAPAAPAARPEVGAFESDVFTRKAPTKAELDAHRATIAALDKLPEAPLGREAKRAWLATVTPRLAAAEKALNALEDAEFWHKSVPAAENDAAREQVRQLRDRIDSAKEAAGVTPPTKPASPVRPLFQLTDGCKDMMGRNAFLAIVGLIAIIPAMMIDALDLVTRPLQALAYPFLWGQYKLRDVQYNREHPATAPAK